MTQVVNWSWLIEAFKSFPCATFLQRRHVTLDLDLGLVVVEDVIADGLVVAQVHRAHLVDVQVLGDDRREALNMQSVPKSELELQ